MGIADYIKSELPKWPNWINRILLHLNVFGDLVNGPKYQRLKKSFDKIIPDEKLLEIVNYAILHVPYYRNRYGNLHINSVEEFEKNIGFIDKDEVMNHWDDFISDEIDWTKCIVGTTGGTSGKPLKLVIPTDRYVLSLLYWNKELSWYDWHNDLKGVIRNHRLPQGRDFLINPVTREILFDGFRMDKKYARIIWRTLKRYKTKFIHSYPSSLYQFCSYCRSLDLDISFVKACFLASEGVTPEQKVLFDLLNIKIYSFYGHSEKLIMAGSCQECDSYHIEDTYGYCELVDEKGNVIKENDITGEMVGTTFQNKYFPLIRYRTGDYSKYAKKQLCPAHGMQYRLLDGVQGRWSKSLIYRIDGSTTSLTALNLHGQFYEHIDGIQYYQDKIGYLKVAIIKNKFYTEKDESFVLEHLGNGMGGEEYVSIEYVEKLIFQSNGKFLSLISTVNV